MGFRRGRKEAAERLGYKEGGDCPRCGHDAEPSSISGYLTCTQCRHDWPDPNASAPERSGRTAQDDRVVLDQFKREVEQAGSFGKLLGIAEIEDEHQEAVSRLQTKWMEGLKGQYNPAQEARKPFSFSMDENDAIQDTSVGQLTLLNNDFDGGEEIRVEYPGKGSEIYTYEATGEKGWKRGRTTVETARNISECINSHSRLVHAHWNGETVKLELRNSKYDPRSLVLYVVDPGGRDILAEKDGVDLDPKSVTVLSDYRTALQLAIDDGVITPSEDQMLWAMRQHLGVSEQQHVDIVRELFGDGVVKECTVCGAMASLYLEYSALYCGACDNWV